MALAASACVVLLSLLEALVVIVWARVFPLLYSPVPTFCAVTNRSGSSPFLKLLSRASGCLCMETP